MLCGIAPKHIVVLDFISITYGDLVDEVGDLVVFAYSDIQLNLESVNKEIIKLTIHMNDYSYRFK